MIPYRTKLVELIILHNIQNATRKIYMIEDCVAKKTAAIPRHYSLHTFDTQTKTTKKKSDSNDDENGEQRNLRNCGGQDG